MSKSNLSRLRCRPPVVGSVADVARCQNVSLAQVIMSVTDVVMIDVSGSMNRNDAPGGRSRYETAAGELRRIQAAHPGQVLVIGFSSAAFYCTYGEPDFEGGGTNMAEALRLAATLDGTVRFYMVSDGEPDSEDEALGVAAGFASRIHTIHIGDESDWRGRDFLRRLASVTGGTFAASDQPAMLAAPIEKLMLLAGG
jgi:hypothetical protein